MGYPYVTQAPRQTPIRRAYGSRRILRNVFSMPISLVNLHFSCSPAAGSGSRCDTPSCSFWVLREMGKWKVFSLLESVGNKLGSGSLPQFLRDKGGCFTNRPRLLPKGRKRDRRATPLSRRYQGDPNPRRIRIPKNSEERVFDADFLSKSSFSVPLATRNVVR